MYTLDVPGVPILLGIKSLNRLGALVDTSEPSLIFTKNFPGIRIPLTRGHNGHLFLNLCKDWCSTSSATSLDCDRSVLGTKGPEQDRGHQVHDIEVVHAETDGSYEHGHPGVQQHFARNLQEGDQPLRDNSHAALRRVDQGDGTTHGRNWEADGSGGRGESLQDPVGCDEVRLGSSSRLRSPRSASLRSSIPRPALHGPVSTGEHVRVERLRSVVDMPVLPPESPILPNVGVIRDSPLRRATELGHHRGGEQDSNADGRGAHHQSDRLGGRRGVRLEEVGGHPSPEGHGQGLSTPQGHPNADGRSLSSDPQHAHGGATGHPQEDAQAGQRDHGGGSRGAGASVPSDHGDEEPGASARRTVIHHLPINTQKDVTLPCHDRPSLSEDALYSSHYDPCHTDSCQCTGELREEQKECIASSLLHASEELADAFLLCATEDVFGCDLVEVCCGEESLLTRVINDRGGRAYRIGLHNNMDLSTSIGLMRAREFLSVVKPRWLWVSPGCGPGSSVQHLSQHTDKQIEAWKKRAKKARRLCNAVLQLCEEQVHESGHICWEWPRNNAGWNLPHVAKFFRTLGREGNLWEAKLDGCMVGVRSRDSHMLVQKAWTIKTTSQAMYHVLSKQCDHTHEHGTSSGSASYPPHMCHAICRVVLESAIGLRPETASAYALEGLDLPPWNEKELKEKKELLRKLHVRCGHPSNRALQSMLRARGADPRLLKLALGLQCDECMEVRLPVPHRNVTLHGSETLWHTVQMDGAQVAVGDQVLHVLIFVDEASRFTVGWELYRCPRGESRNPTTDEIIQALERAWVQYHGYPNVLRMDPEGAFRGTALGEWAASRGISLEPCPAEDHGQIGIVEATIRTIKDGVRTFLRDKVCDPFSAVIHDGSDRGLCASPMGLWPLGEFGWTPV